MGRFASDQPSRSARIRLGRPRAPSTYRIKPQAASLNRQERLVRRIIAFSIMVAFGLASGWMVGGVVNNVFQGATPAEREAVYESAAPAASQPQASQEQAPAKRPEDLNSQARADEQASAAGLEQSRPRRYAQRRGNESQMAVAGVYGPKRNKSFKKILKHFGKANPAKLPQGLARLKIW